MKRVFLIVLDFIVFLCFQQSDIDNHVKFVCAVFYRLIGLFNLFFKRVVAFRERDNRADFHFVADVLFCLFDKSRRNTNRRGVILDSIITNLFDLLQVASGARIVWSTFERISLMSMKLSS